MATIQELQDAVIAQLASLTNLTGFDFLPDSFPVPCALVGTGDIDYHTSFGRGVAEYDTSILVIVARTSEESGQAALDDYRSRGSVNSIPDLIDSDKTLGGVAATSELGKSSPHTAITIGGVSYIAVQFNLTIYA